MIAVFGANGFVGRNMVESLIAKDFNVVATDLGKSKLGPKVDYKEIDILDEGAVDSVVKDSEYVIHLAASGLPFSLNNPKLNMRINVEGTLNILDAARKHSVKGVLFSSASSIYGTVNYNPVDESHPCVPKTPYAVAKYSIENYLRVYQELYNLNYVIFRFFNVYGPWQYPESGALIPNVMKKILDGEAVTLTGDGSSTRDFIYVGDVNDFFAHAMTKDIKNDVFNMGTGRGTTIKEVVDISGKIIGKEPKIEYKPPRAGEIANFSADTKKLKKVFGSVPSTTLKSGLAKTWQWFDKNK